MIFLLSGVALTLESEEVAAAPVYRYFVGTIGGINNTSAEGLPAHYNLSITGTFQGNLTANGPYTYGYINLTNGDFSIMVDNEKNDPTLPWGFELDDSYGWNHSIKYTHMAPNPWSDPTEEIPDGSLWYERGVFGNISFTVLNGSSGEPLDGVGFHFRNHPFHQSIHTGNYTDANGNVSFDNLQMGLDGNSNEVYIEVEKGNFTYTGGENDNVLLKTIFNGTSVHYNITLEENDLVASYAPSSPDNTDLPVNKDQIPSRVFVTFNDHMDRTTIDDSNLYLKEQGGAKVAITYDWATDSLCKIVPDNDLDYNTTYEVFITPRVKKLDGNESLWRTFSYSFSTQKRPGVLRCQVYTNGTMDPAPDGSMIKLDTNLPQLLVDGYYEFDNVLPAVEGHTVQVIGPTVGGISEYLYYGNSDSGIHVNRGDILDVMGLVTIKRPVRDTEIEVLDEDGNHIEGATVTHRVTKESKVTDITGKVTFEDILQEWDTGFDVSYPNYFDSTVTVSIGTEDPTMVNVTLYENDFPLVIKARSDYTIDLAPGTIITVDSNIQIDFKDDEGFSLPMNPDTITKDSLKIIDPLGVSVALEIVDTPGDLSRWTLEPNDYLKYDTKYTIFIQETVASNSGINPLWRDFTLEIKTEGLDPSAVLGRVAMLVSEKGIEGIDIDVKHNGNVIASTTTEYNGNYFVQVDLTEFVIYNVTVVADGSAFGLSIEEFGPISLTAGGSKNDTDFALTRQEDWFQVLYPKDDEGRMPVDASIVLKFKTPLDTSNMDSFMDNFTISPSNIALNVTIQDDGRTIIIQPLEPLDYDKRFILQISEHEDDYYKELKDVNGSFALVRGEKIEIITEFKPIEVNLLAPSSNLLESTPVDLPIRLFFTNYSVNPALVEPMVVFEIGLTGKVVENLTFTWSNQFKTLDIEHDDLDGSTEYRIGVIAGKYGAGESAGARIREDYIFTFTTINQLIDVTFDSIWNPAVDEGGNVVQTFSNPLARPVMIVILVEEVLNSNEFIEYQNFTLAELQGDKPITITTSELDIGEYTVLINVYNPSTGVLLSTYYRNIKVEEEQDDPSDNLWIFIVIGIIVIIFAVLAVFLFSQSRKKDLDEELNEEFECPECHHLVSDDDTVCPHCGAEFEEEAYKCPKCGSMLDPDDEECPECGYDFEDQEKMEMDDDDDVEEGEIELDDDEDDDEDEEMNLDEEDEMEELEDEEEEEEDEED